MKTPLLSICIATYNRAHYIGETLNSIIPQLEDDVELLIVDGASTDNTENIALGFTKNESRVRYIRLPAKGGVDRDYDKAVEFAQGEFCWLFTDDDLLKPGAIAAVKKAIKTGHDLIVVNAEVRDLKLSAVLQHKKIIIDEDKEYAPDDLAGLFACAMPYLSFIGAVVIRRSLWLNRDREPYFGTEFIHVGVIFQKLIPAPALIISEPYITCRWGNAKWAQSSFNIWMFKWPKLIWSFKDIPSEAKSLITAREPWLDLKKLIIERDEGRYDLQTYHRHFSNMRVNFLWKSCAWLTATFPRKIIAGVHYIYKQVKRGARATGLCIRSF